MISSYIFLYYVSIGITPQLFLKKSPKSVPKGIDKEPPRVYNVFMPENNKMIHLHILVRPEERDILESESKKVGLNKSSFIRSLIRRWANENNILTKTNS